MRIKPGDSIIHFEEPDYQGEIFRSADLAGKKWMLSFYRYAACPFCNLRIHELKKKYLNEWKENNFEMVGVFQSPAESIRKYAGEELHYFRIIPNPARHLYRIYRVEKSWAGFYKALLRLGEIISFTARGLLRIDPEGPAHRLPADFLIDEKGTIVRAYYAKDIGDHIPMKEIDDWLSQ